MTHTPWVSVDAVVLGLLANGLAVVRVVPTRRALRMEPISLRTFPVAFSAVVTLLGAALAVYLIARLV